MSDAMQESFVLKDLLENDWITTVSHAFRKDDGKKLANLATFWSTNTNLHDYYCDARCVLDSNFFKKFLVQP